MFSSKRRNPTYIVTEEGKFLKGLNPQKDFNYGFIGENLGALINFKKNITELFPISNEQEITTENLLK